MTLLEAAMETLEKRFTPELSPEECETAARIVLEAVAKRLEREGIALCNGYTLPGPRVFDGNRAWLGLGPQEKEEKP